jgi:hypothetical protein
MLVRLSTGEDGRSHVEAITLPWAGGLGAESRYLCEGPQGSNSPGDLRAMSPRGIPPPATRTPSSSQARWRVRLGMGPCGAWGQGMSCGLKTSPGRAASTVSWTTNPYWSHSCAYTLWQAAIPRDRSERMVSGRSRQIASGAPVRHKAGT